MPGLHHDGGLVSVFVLSIGVLGVAGLQVTAKRSNFEATQRVTAVALAQGIIERMRANSDQLGTYTNAGAGRTMNGTSMSAVDCTTDCGPVTLAQCDLYELEQAADGVAEQAGGNNVGGLALPTTCITGPDGGPGTYSVAIANNYTSTPTLSEMENAVSARVYLLARSIEADPFFTNVTQYVLGDATIAAANDGFYRRVYSTTISLRNTAARSLMQ